MSGLFAYDDAGKRVGSNECEEGKFLSAEDVVLWLESVQRRV